MPQSRKFKCSDCGKHNGFCEVIVNDPENDLDDIMLDTLIPTVCPWSKNTAANFEEV